MRLFQDTTLFGLKPGFYKSWANLLFALTFAACDPDPRATSQAKAEAQILARQVSCGAIDDCEALARFTDAASAGDAVALLDAFNHFIPRDKSNYPLGWPIGLTGVAQPVKFEGAVSGYRAKFRKGYEPGRLEGTAHDQAHHFAPYFILGARVPRPVALRFLELAERRESWGDLNLGREAIELGGRLADKDLTPGAVSGEIRARLCDGRAEETRGSE